MEVFLFQSDLNNIVMYKVLMKSNIIPILLMLYSLIVIYSINVCITLTRENYCVNSLREFMRTGLQVQIVHKDLANKRGPNNNITT